MARLRSYLLPALVIGVLAMWAGTIDSARLFDTWGLMSDVESDTNNTITADTLGAPSGLDAKLPTTSQITVTWTATDDGYATGYDIFRCAGVACSFGGLPTFQVTEGSVGCGGGGTCTYVNNTGLTQNTTYCYKVRTTYLGWSSGFSNTDCEKTLAAGTTLLLHNNNTMSGTPAVTSGEIEIQANNPDASYIWSYTPGTGAVLGTNQITLLIVQGDRPSEQAGASATVRIGYGTDCASMTTVVNTSITVPQSLTDQGVTFAFTPSVAHTFVVGEKLCLQIINTAGPPSDSRGIKIRTDDASSSGVLGTSSLFVPLTGP